VRQRLKSERVQEGIAALTSWRQLPGGKAIDRAFRFPTSGVAAAFAKFVSMYAGESGHPINLNISKGDVVVTLAGPQKRGRQGDLTEEIVAFARMLG